MADLLFVALIVGFFALCTLLVRACDRLVGPDGPEVPGPEGSGPEEVALPVPAPALVAGVGTGTGTLTGTDGAGR